MQLNAPCPTGPHFLLSSINNLDIANIFKLGLMQAVCLDACKKLHQMGAFTDMLLPDKGSGVESEKVEQDEEGDPIPGTSRHREFYPEGVADILRVSALILL